MELSLEPPSNLKPFWASDLKQAPSETSISWRPSGPSSATVRPGNLQNLHLQHAAFSHPESLQRASKTKNKGSTSTVVLGQPTLPYIFKVTQTRQGRGCLHNRLPPARLSPPISPLAPAPAPSSKSAPTSPKASAFAASGLHGAPTGSNALQHSLHDVAKGIHP